jgi:hypothetical protein
MATYWLRGAVATLALILLSAGALGVLRSGASAFSDLEQRCTVGRDAGGGSLHLTCEGDQVCAVVVADPGAGAIDIDCGDEQCLVTWAVDYAVALDCEARSAGSGSQSVVRSTSSVWSASTGRSSDQVTTAATVSLQTGDGTVALEIDRTPETLTIVIRR